MPVLTALGVGLVAALAIYAGGPLAVAGVALAGSTLNLLSLARTIRAGAATLDVLRTP